MPELPEVETIVQDLQPTVGLKIIACQIYNKSSINLSVRRLSQQLFNLPIKAVRRLGKHIVFDLGQVFLVVHLKMTGQLIWQRGQKLIVGGHPIVGQGPKLPNKFTRIQLTFNNRSHLFFNDVRKFGWLKILSPVELEKYATKFGWEPLDKTFTIKVFRQLLASQSTRCIKAWLLDQTKVMGIGNIYADESLFLAKIRPARLVKSLTAQEIDQLYRAIKQVLKKSIKYRGTSFHDYVDTQGRTGNYLKHLQVYSRANLPCLVCQTPISKIRLAGRGTHYCSGCQV